MFPGLDYFQLLIISIVSFLIVYSIGHLFVGFVIEKTKHSFFVDYLKMLSGILIIITAYSIFKSSFFTINIGFLLLFLLFLFYLTKVKKWKFNREQFKQALIYIPVKNLIIYIFLIALFYTFQFYKLKDPFDNTYFALSSDYVCYATNIENLNLTGVEGIKNNLALLKETQRGIYHFGELWFSAFFCKLFNIRAVSALLLITFPMAYLLYCIGILSVFQFFSKKQNLKFIYAFSVIFLFISGISFYLPKNTIFTQGDWYDLGVFFHTKIIFCVGIILLAANFLLRRNYYLVFISMLALPVLSTPTAPAVYMCLSLFALYLWYRKEISKRTFYLFLLLIILCFSYLIGYILLISVSNNALATSASALPIKTKLISLSFIFFKTVFNCFAGQLIKIILSNIIYIAIGYLVLKKEKNLQLTHLFVFLILLNFCGLISYSIFHRLIDSIQLWLLFYIPISGIVFIIILFYFVNTASWWSKLITICIVLICLYQNKLFDRLIHINVPFIQKVFAVYEKSERKRIVSLCGKEEFTSIYVKSIDIMPPLNYMKMFIDNFNPISLSSFNIPINKSTPIIENAENEIVKNTIFYKYVERKKSSNDFESVEKSQIQFIKEYHADFIILTPTAKVFPELNAMIGKVIEDEDGTKFCTLKY